MYLVDDYDPGEYPPPPPAHDRLDIPLNRVNFELPGEHAWIVLEYLPGCEEHRIDMAITLCMAGKTAAEVRGTTGVSRSVLYRELEKRD